MNLYNDIEPFACQWMSNLIAAGELPQGFVDSRSIKDIRGEDLNAYTQSHFFAGIGGWSAALALAGWSSERPIWTGSCPCQPFSVAGKRKGTGDERHLWPEMFRLIQECRPGVVIGEQVDGKDGLRWLDGVFADLEGSDYACGAIGLPAACAGSPHIRQRLFWLAYAGQPPTRRDSGSRLAVEAGQANQIERDEQAAIQSSGCRHANRVGHANDARPQGRESLNRNDGEEFPTAERASGESHWSDFEIISCLDGKARRIGRGVQPVAHGIRRDLGSVRAILEGMGFDAKSVKRMLRRPRSVLALAGRNRVGRLKGYGNAIHAGVAAMFVKTVMEILDERIRS